MFSYFLVQAISNSSCSWLVDDSENIEARDCSSIFSGLTLRVVEVGRYCDNSVVDSLKQGTFIILKCAYRVFFFKL